ncbi:MAG TPA: hypothetical protein VF131_21790 [Blastocatellia bacterium]|nr:hypothetical protein [Blastocatellia bacterium]
MRKLSLSILLFLALAVSSARADTIHLKNGSVLKGKVASFAAEQFVVMLDTGSGRYMSKAMIHIGDVERIEFDSAPGQADAGAIRDAAPPPVTQPSEPAQREVARDTPRDTPARDTPARDTPPRSTGPVDTQPATSRDPEPAQPDRPAASPPTVEASDTNPPRKMTGPVRTMVIDLPGKREVGQDWVSSQVLLTVGDQVRITATGTITLDKVNRRTSGPEGTDQADPGKLMQDYPTGALIGVIGSEDNDFIVIGRSVEFTATKRGLLFLAVNEGTLSDNSGSYKVTIEVSRKPN